MNLRDVSLLIGILLASMLVLTALNFVFASKLPDYVDPCEWIAFDMCHTETGLLAADVIGLSGNKLRGDGAIRQLSIVEVYHLTSTSKCVMIMLPNGATAAIRGTYEDVMQRLNKPGCKP